MHHEATRRDLFQACKVPKASSVMDTTAAGYTGMCGENRVPASASASLLAIYSTSAKTDDSQPPNTTTPNTPLPTATATARDGPRVSLRGGCEATTSRRPRIVLIPTIEGLEISDNACPRDGRVCDHRCQGKLDCAACRHDESVLRQDMDGRDGDRLDIAPKNSSKTTASVESSVGGRGALIGLETPGPCAPFGLFSQWTGIPPPHLAPAACVRSLPLPSRADHGNIGCSAAHPTATT
ncbi:hypothetical protein DFH27DRAFT_601566 [Peziza echinospora]|nr:hypothetical protein DFH27DRAFT_601566 [Peziza echinospora]